MPEPQATNHQPGEDKIMEQSDHTHRPDVERHPRPDIHIIVNERPVTVDRHRLTGLEIKESAIAQQVPIQLDFVLSEELPHGKTKIIGDQDTITVHNGSKFNAVAPDDNS